MQVKRDLEKLQELQTSDPSSPQLGPLIQVCQSTVKFTRENAQVAPFLKIESTCLQLLNEHLGKLTRITNSPWWFDAKFVKLGKSYVQNLLGIALNALRHYKVRSCKLPRCFKAKLIHSRAGSL
jgi:hypothetical protein